MSTQRSRLILAGAGRFAEEITDIAADAGLDVAAWIEGLALERADPGHQPPIVWVADQRSFEPALPVAPAIGSPRRRALIERLVSEGRELATLIHPSAVVARSASIGPGCVLFAGVIVGARTTIGVGTIINRGALIGHHTAIGSHVFVGPGANIAGGVTIGDESYIAMAAVVRDDRTVGARATIGAGAVVVGDVPADTTVVGLPARPLAIT
jgi:sugar O-acyltransferase (sialic acid O-acetyltransferase NeuD family)